MSDVSKLILDDAEYDLVDESARERLDALESTVGDIDVSGIAAMKDAVAQNTEGIATLKSDLASTAETASANASAIEDLQGDASANAKSIAAIKKTAETNAAQIMANKAECDAVAERVTTAEGNIDQINTDASALTERVGAAETVIATLETNENTIQEDLTALKSTTDTHTTEIGDLSALTTTVKTDLVSAINEAAASGGSSGGDPDALAMLWGKDYEGNRTSTVTYNSDGNVSSISETGDGNAATRTYTYDSDGRITKEAVTGTTPDGSYTKTKELTYSDSGATKIVETYQHTASDPTWADIAAKFKAGLGNIAYKVGDLFSEDWDHYTSGTSHTKYTAPWRYEGSENVTLEDGSKQTGGWIEFAYLTPSYMQFDRPEALYAAVDGLAAGTYYVTHGSTNLQFTLTQDVEAGGRIAFHSTTSSASTSSVDSYKSDGKTLVETVSTTSGTEGTSLGTCQDYLADGNLNGWYLALYGSGRWKDSHVRQWLNSAAAAGEWWTPSHKFDIVPRSADVAVAGFLHGLPQELIDVMIPTRTITYPASVYGNDPDITYDKVILPSWGQMYTQEQYNAENEPLAYYRQLNGTSSRWSRTSAYAARKKYRLDSTSSTSSYWIRSASRDNARSAWYVYSSGHGNDGNAYGNNRLAPLACIG